MSKNRRSGNAGDTAAAYSDTAELLNKETAQLLADSMRSEGAPSFEAADSLAAERGLSVQPIPEKKAADKPEVTSESKKRARKPKAVSEAAAELAEDKGSEKSAAKSEGNKRARKPKAASEAAAELADNKGSEKSVAKSEGNKRARKSGAASEAAAELAEDKGSEKSEVKTESKRRARNPKAVADALAAELIEGKPELSLEGKKRSRKVKPAADETEAELAEDKGSEKSEVKTESKKRVRKPKAAVEESADKVSDNDDEPGRGCKTPQVLKLLDGDGDNLVLFAGKSRVPNLLRGRESLSRMARKNGAPDADYTEVVNITELVIRHEAAGILDRFNACSCEKCVRVFSEIIAQRIPVRYARISRAELESGELPERAASMRQVVLPEMIRQLICNKKRCFHDE